MTAFRIVRLRCDQRGCLSAFEARPELGFPPAGVMRAEAAKAGWTRQRSSLGHRFDTDYCPDHKPQEDPR